MFLQTKLTLCYFILTILLENQNYIIFEKYYIKNSQWSIYFFYKIKYTFLFVHRLTFRATNRGEFLLFW
jgi:hypothetical protein